MVFKHMTFCVLGRALTNSATMQGSYSWLSSNHPHKYKAKQGKCLMYMYMYMCVIFLNVCSFYLLVCYAHDSTCTHPEQHEFPSPELGRMAAHTQVTLQPLVAQTTHVQQAAMSRDMHTLRCTCTYTMYSVPTCTCTLYMYIG